MAIALGTHTSKGSVGDADVTTTGIDTTGANLLVAVLSSYDSALSSFSDSKSNVWTGLTQRSLATGGHVRIVYVKNPTVGSGHTFTGNGAGGGRYMTLSFASFSGADTTSPFDVENGGTASTVTTIATGSISPTADNELIIAGLSSYPGRLATIGGGFTVADTVDSSAANHVQGALAYLIQTTATAANPSWSWTDSATSAGAAIASFKSAGGGAVTRPTNFQNFIITS